MDDIGTETTMSRMRHATRYAYYNPVKSPNSRENISFSEYLYIAMEKMMSEKSNEATTFDSELNDSSKRKPRNLILRRVGIVAAIIFLLASSLVFLFASVAPGYLGSDLQLQLKGHPVIEAEFGELQTCVMSYSATFSNGNPDVILFDVVGTKDKGQLIVNQVTADRPSFNLDTIVIRKYDGREIPLSNAPPNAPPVLKTP